MAVSLISVCNAALDECPAGTINSIDEDDVGARACKRRWRPTLDDLLGEHDYDFAIRRVAMAEVDNDRRNEWVYCYSLPDGCASPRRVMPSYSAAYVSSSYILQPGQRLWTGIGFFPNNVGARFVVADNRVYTNMPTAVLEYVTLDVEFGYFRPLFRRAFELELASRIVMPILKDTRRQGELIRMAEIARQRAMADDMNSSPERSFDFVSEDGLVRVGGVDPSSASNYGTWG